MQREVSIERFDAHKGEDWAIMMMANAMRGEKDWVKPMWRPYFDAMMKLIAQRPDLYRMHGYSCRDIHFRNFKRTGKNNVRLVSCEAYWQQVEGAR